VHQLIDFELLALFVMIPALNFARLEGDELWCGAGIFHGLPRIGQFDLLDAIGR
jgi:hypothetical protein